MEIRKIKIEDLESLAQLYKYFWNEDSDLSKMEKSFNKIKDNPNYIILNALINQKIVGTITGIICEDLYGDCSPYLVIENFIVDEQQRRKGIGRKLLSTLESIAKQNGCCQVILITDTERSDAQAFYESCGYPKGKNVGYKKKL